MGVNSSTQESVSKRLGKEYLHIIFICIYNTKMYDVIQQKQQHVAYVAYSVNVHDKSIK